MTTEPNGSIFSRWNDPAFRKQDQPATDCST
jgi:hypothetical protein